MTNNRYKLPQPIETLFHAPNTEDNSRAIPLPQPIATFYHASDIYDEDLLASCLAEDAMLIDEEEEYLGPKAVSSHILEANRVAKVMTEITNCVEKDGETIVTATISGKFNGSPIPLDFHFTISNGKIKNLNIEVAGE